MIKVRKGACVAFEKKEGVLTFAYVIDVADLQVLYLNDNMYRETTSKNLVKQGTHIPFTEFIESSKARALKDGLAVTSAQIKQAMKTAKKDPLCEHHLIRESFKEALERREKLTKIANHGKIRAHIS